MAVGTDGHPCVPGASTSLTCSTRIERACLVARIHTSSEVSESVPWPDGLLQRNMYTSTSVHSGETTAAAHGGCTSVHVHLHGEGDDATAGRPRAIGSVPRLVSRHRACPARPDDARPDRGRSRAYVACSSDRRGRPAPLEVITRGERKLWCLPPYHPVSLAQVSLAGPVHEDGAGRPAGHVPTRRCHVTTPLGRFPPCAYLAGIWLYVHVRDPGSAAMCTVIPIPSLVVVAGSLPASGVRPSGGDPVVD
jgi:hypothetical protein